mgnify:FL=1
MNKPVQPPRNSLLERAAEVYDFGSALRGTNLPPLDIPAAAIPSAPAPQPTVHPSVPDSVPPVARTRDWTGTPQTLDRAAMAEAGYMVPGGPVSGVSEEFRIIKRELLATIRGTKQQGPLPHGNVILIASAHSGDGKTYCAINLAVSLAAETDLEILLVDADFGKPSIMQALGLSGTLGFMDALVDPSVAVEDCVVATDIPSLFVLPSGTTTNRDAEYLASARMEQILSALVDGRPNRVVLFDSPPLLAATPAAVLAAHVGQTVLVVRADRTSEAALRDAADLLGDGSAIRLLLNGVKFSASGRRFGTYYGKEG